ncbi:clavesin-2-like [Diorhabda carinulata]|uniref:clavesin-2-like n=1 Tax=Diorhabda sublineata TaxID=1163346 RepID=UPI0024E13A87|nr:clavesin-2-like [Diorhabda sublineata]XP_057658946.1 clavesin-2-like [Diorhabda carinulata]XP_057658947.1 clavesin-2-like [Diorhabda carinulata]
MTTKSELIMMDTWTDRCNFNIRDNKFFNRKLKKELFEIASKELRENENARKECVAHLRNWVNQHPDIENCLTDDSFLLRFLRVKKFSLSMTEQILLKYLNFRKRFKHFMYNMDCLDRNVSEIIGDGFLFVSPFRDSFGRRVIIYDIGKFNLHKFNGVDLAKTFALTYETLLDDEENQILGVTHVANLAGASLNYVPLFTATEFAIMVRWGEQSIPMRHKQIDVLNMPSIVKFVFDFALTLASDKLKRRLNVHSSIDQLHTKVNRRCLPSELGGDIPSKEMIRLWKAELEGKRKRLLSYDDMNLLSDRGIIRRRKPVNLDENGISDLPGSFRKLDFD